MGGMTSSSTTSKPVIPGFARGFMKDIFKDANKAYSKGPYYYEGSTVTPMSKQTTAGLDGLMGLASANSGGAGMSGHLQGIMSSGGFNPGQQAAMDSISKLAGNRGMNELINGNGLNRDQNLALTALKATTLNNNMNLQNTFDNGGLTADQRLVADRYRTEMQSPFDIASNPAYAQVRQRTLDAGANSVQNQMAKMGRLGGGANQDILARAQSDIANTMDMNEYRNWQARQDAAAGGLASLSGSGLSNQLGINSAQQSGIQNVANLAGVGVNQQSNAIGQKAGLESSLFNMNQAGLDNMRQAYQTAQMPYQTMTDVGSQYENLYTRQMQDKLRTFDARNPFNQFSQYMGLVSGAPTGSVQTSNPSWMQLGLGGLLAGSAFL